MDIDELVLNIGNELLNKGASDVQIYNVEQKTKVAKRLVVCTAVDNEHAKAIAVEIKEFVKPYIICLHNDGISKGDWIVLDFRDIIVHIFTKDTRLKYNLEKLWKDQKNCLILSQNN